MRLLADIENLIGLTIEKDKEPKGVIFENEEDIFSSQGELHVFFPDPFALSMRFFEFPFGGKKAKNACEVELSAVEIFENERYIIWTPRKEGTTVAFIYEPDITNQLMEKAASILFKPVCLIPICEKYENTVAVEVGKKTVSLAYKRGDKLRFAFFRYSEVEDIKYQTSMFLSQVENKENINFALCGVKREIFPFDGNEIKPSDIFEVENDNPDFTLLFCAALGKYPEIKIEKSKRKIKIEPFLERTLPASIMSFLIIVSLITPKIITLTKEKEKREFFTAKIREVFEATFPGQKVVDPYSQMKMEYSKIQKDNEVYPFEFLTKFSKRVAEHVIRIEDLRIDESGEISAQLEISELSQVEKIRQAVSDIIDNYKVTSTVRSREGNTFIMRLTGNAKKNAMSKM